MAEGENVPGVAQNIACVGERLTFWNKDRFGIVGQQIKWLQGYIALLSKRTRTDGGKY